MVTVETRPFEDGERQELARLLRAARKGGEPYLAGALAALIISAVALLVWPWQYGIASLPPVIAGAVVGFVVFRRLRGKSAGWHATSTLADELARGQAEVTTYEAVDAIAVEEEGDEGSQYFVKLRDGRVLFLGGQYLYELEDEEQFPNTRFQVVRTPRTHHLLGFTCLGGYLPPSSRRRAFSRDDYRSRRVPDDGAVWEGDFEAFRQS